MKPAIYVEIEQELKDKIVKLAKEERRTLKSFILLLIERKIAEVQNAIK